VQDHSAPWIVGGLLLMAGVGIVRAVQVRQAGGELGSDAGGCVPMVGPGSRVLLIGDSMAVGLTPHVKRLSNASGADCQVLTQAGSHVEQWLVGQSHDALIATLRELKPTLVVAALGLSDSKSGLSVEHIRSKALMLATQLTVDGAALLWVLPPALPFEDRMTPALSGSSIRTFVTRRLPLPKGPDGMSPTAAGYAGWARQLWLSLSCFRQGGFGGLPLASGKPQTSLLTPVQLPKRPSRPVMIGRKRRKRV